MPFHVVATPYIHLGNLAKEILSRNSDKICKQSNSIQYCFCIEYCNYFHYVEVIIYKSYNIQHAIIIQINKRKNSFLDFS